MKESAARAAGRRLPSVEDLPLSVPECPKGIGATISAADSPQLIQGVRLCALRLYPDDRGYFLEVHRMGLGLAAAFPAASAQVSAAFNYAGTVKAFHYHVRQTDYWAPALGMVQVALVDLRLNSATFGKRNTIYAGTLAPWQILIPPGVAHGYKVIGSGEAMLIYLTDRFYDPEDEGRLPYNDPSINYDWETQRK
jgi:dTDP-4-dehydrorhamnose 3,5-epimerase